MSEAAGARRARWVWALIGLVLAAGAPLGLGAWLWLRGLDLGGEVAQAALGYSALGTAIVFTLMGAFAGSMMDRQREAALRDGLTGLYNRRFMRESLLRLQAAVQRTEAPLSVIMLDLDHFKRVNDTHGHLVGDQTLRAVAQVLSSSSRASDVVARYGGEEFAILCPDTDRATGERYAERLRRAIEAIDAKALGFPGPQTVSLGLAVQSPSYAPTPEQLLGEADAALYRAKRAGRNCVRASEDGVSEEVDP